MDDSEKIVCDRCAGTGRIFVEDGGSCVQREETCPRCGGSGLIDGPGEPGE